MKQSLRATLFAVTLGVVLLAAGLLSADTIQDHQLSQSRPVQLGTSGGNINDRSTMWCCSGTLGALVNLGGVQYILSNNHVLARTNEGETGDAITQPGLIDESPVCAQKPADAVANLSTFVPINFKKGTSNTVDAAIARVVDGKVDTHGTIMGIGTLNGTATPSLNSTVRKSGRTTGVTTGTLAAVGVTINVKYGSQCGGGRGTGTFRNQIRITDGTFSDSGDSGSLIVTMDAPAKAVGLLFAGGSNDTFANPIQAVLDAFPGATMVAADSGGFKRWFARLLPSVARAQAASPFGPVHPGSQAAAAHAKERNERALLAIEGVVGVGVGVSETVAGEAVVEVYVEKATPAVRSAIPGHVDRVPVKVVETGEIKARC